MKNGKAIGIGQLDCTIMHTHFILGESTDNTSRMGCYGLGGHETRIQLEQPLSDRISTTITTQAEILSCFQQSLEYYYSVQHDN